MWGGSGFGRVMPRAFSMVGPKYMFWMMHPLLLVHSISIVMVCVVFVGGFLVCFGVFWGVGQWHIFWFSGHVVMIRLSYLLVGVLSMVSLSHVL